MHHKNQQCNFQPSHDQPQCNDDIPTRSKGPSPIPQLASSTSIDIREIRFAPFEPKDGDAEEEDRGEGVHESNCVRAISRCSKCGKRRNRLFANSVEKTRRMRQE